jgi:hypothetical protein
MRLLASVLVAAMACACASKPVSDEQRALNLCLYAEDQSGWTLLGTPPPIADLLRSAIVAAHWRPVLKPDDHEYWFSRADGRYLRCTNELGGMYEAEGMAAICGTTTYTLTRVGESWSVETSPIVFCQKRR